MLLTAGHLVQVYMAPEVFQRQYGMSADLWSLGMMFYELLACRLPFW